jgi:hypothetical protein
MDLSIFLAKLIGIYLLLVAFTLLFRKKEVEGSTKDFASSKGLITLSGSLSLFLGLAIVISHPIFIPGWQGVISFVGALLIVRGLFRIIFPSRVQKNLTSSFHKWYWLVFLITLFLGLFLTAAGFMA